MTRKSSRQIIVQFVKNGVTDLIRDSFNDHVSPNHNPSPSRSNSFFIDWGCVQCVVTIIKINAVSLLFLPWPGMKFSWEEGGDKIVMRDREKELVAWFWAKHVEKIGYRRA